VCDGKSEALRQKSPAQSERALGDCGLPWTTLADPTGLENFLPKKLRCGKEVCWPTCRPDRR
jgi:hypothetical protein